MKLWARPANGEGNAITLRSQFVSSYIKEKEMREPFYGRISLSLSLLLSWPSPALRSVFWLLANNKREIRKTFPFPVDAREAVIFDHASTGSD